MIVVGADLATSSGICYGRPDTTPHATAIKAPSSGVDLGAWGAFYWTYFNTLFDQLGERLEPGELILVNYESPILPEKRFDKAQQKMVGGTNIQTTRKLHSLGLMLETVANVRNERGPVLIDVRECHLSSIKKELGGSGSSNKDAMVYVARRSGISLPEGEEAKDAADAFGAWLLAIRHHAPRPERDYWDRRISSGFRR